MARPTKLTPERAERILELLRQGATIRCTCDACGIDPATFYRWLERGEHQPRGKFREFRNSVKKALAEAELRLVNIIQTEAAQTWQAAAWLLERRWPDEWRQRQSLEHEGGDKPVSVRLTGIDPRRIADDPELKCAIERVITELGGCEGDAGGSCGAGEPAL